LADAAAFRDRVSTLRALLTPPGYLLGAAGVSAALLLGAFAFEVFGNFPPCPMCVTQRWIHAGVIAAALGAFAVLRAGGSYAVLRAAAPLLPGGVLLASAIYAARHAAVEYGFIQSGCSAAGAGPADLDSLLADLDRAQNIVLCDEAAWSLFGVSMAGYNALISLAAALAGAYVTWRVLKGAPA